MYQHFPNFRLVLKIFAAMESNLEAFCSSFEKHGLEIFPLPCTTTHPDRCQASVGQAKSCRCRGKDKEMNKQEKVWHMPIVRGWRMVVSKHIAHGLTCAVQTHIHQFGATPIGFARSNLPLITTPPSSTPTTTDVSFAKSAMATSTFSAPYSTLPDVANESYVTSQQQEAQAVGGKGGNLYARRVG